MAGFIGGQGGINNAFMIVRLKPLGERKISAQKVIERIRKNQPKVPGGRMFLMADQDLQFGGGRQSSSAYAYTLLASDLNDLRTWVPRVTRRYPNCRSSPASMPMTARARSRSV